MAYLQPLSRSASHSHSPKKMPSRPALKSNNTWTTSSVGSTCTPIFVTYRKPDFVGTLDSSSHTRSHVTFHQPTSLHMHPLFAYSRLHHAPIQYDVGRTPSARTVLDCTTHSPVPAHTLAQPASDPPTAAPDQLVLRSHKFPWTIVVKASSVSSSNKKIKRSNSRSSVTGTVITNLDVLYAIHTTLLARVTPEEWEALGNGSKAHRKVTRAYEKRCSVMGGWEGGVRRVDWLGGKTHLIGIEVDRSSGNGVGKLVFARIC